MLGGMENILVGVDGSAGSKRAAHFAAQLAKRTDANLTLLLVLEPPTGTPLSLVDAYAFTRGRPTPASIAEARKLLDEIPHELPQGRVERLVEIGHAADVILEKAKELRVDHVVVGARGLGAGARWLLGSVSDRVAHHAHCPVTVVR